MYLFWLPFVIKGFFRDRILHVWTALLLVGSFNALVTPFAAIVYWERWMMMLIYPFTFFATNGLEKIFTKAEPRRIWRNLSKILMAISVVMSIMFMILPPNLSIFAIPAITPYFPSSMQQNTIPLEDVEGTIESLRYLNGNMNENSCVLVYHAFIDWARLYLDRNHTVIYYAMNLTKAIEVAQQNGFTNIYLIWWSRDKGWYYNMEIPDNFETAESSGRISTYRYLAS